MESRVAWDHRHIAEHAAPAEHPGHPGLTPPAWQTDPYPSPYPSRPAPPEDAGDRHGRRRGWWRSPRVPGPLRRSTTNRMAGGVAGGLSARFGIDAVVVRIAFVLLAVGGGTGLALYVAAWLFIPPDYATESIAKRALADRRTVGLALALGVALIALLSALATLGAGFAANLVWPASIAAGGLVLVWRGADDRERTFLQELVGQTPLLGTRPRRTRRATVARVVFGAALVLVGLTGLANSRRVRFNPTEAFLSGNLIIVGVLVAFGPWWLRLARDLAFERRERVRTEERAHMAATVHDSVLQTRALIQRAAGDHHEVTRLARAQERELRAWLFEGKPPGSFDRSEVTTVAQAVAVVERDVEASHHVAVETVTVGDCELTDDLRALMAAGREATVNAATWSGAPTVSLFVEVEPAKVSVFVRDRGKGFDADEIGPDRRGITESIRARVVRHGGTAAIRSAIGQGTEVELVMPRSA